VRVVSVNPCTLLARHHLDSPQALLVAQDECAVERGIERVECRLIKLLVKGTL
jgi:hypothetical protein